MLLTAQCKAIIMNFSEKIAKKAASFETIQAEPAHEYSFGFDAAKARLCEYVCFCAFLLQGIVFWPEIIPICGALY